MRSHRVFPPPSRWGCRITSALVPAFLLALTTGARAEEARFLVERFRPALDRDGIVDVEWGGVAPHLTWDAAAIVGYELNPLMLTDDGQRVSALIGHRVPGHLVLALSLLDWIELGVDLPVILLQTRNDAELPDVVATPGGLQVTALSDIRLAPKLRLLRAREHFLDVAIMPALTLPTAYPTGPEGSYVGEQQLTLLPELAVSRAILEGALSGLRTSVNVGLRLRPSQRAVLGLRVGSEFTWRAGVGYRLKALTGLPIELQATASGATWLMAPFSSGFEESPLEVLGGASWDVLPAVQVFGAAGVGAISGFGTPDFRALIGVRLAPRTDDADGDGVPDREDRCKAEAEDHDGFNDSDGCPEPDNDNDGLADKSDPCPNAAEDVDGSEDSDGCPDPDNDFDGVEDALDKCVAIAGPKENDGCPDGDGDGDGIVDKSDRCPDLAGVAALQGCPDADGDGITDTSDQCPNAAGLLQFAGCSDEDGDGIVGAKDRCPEQAEIINNIDDEDGCPDEGVSLVKLTADKIEIDDKVYFDSNNATLQERSHALLDQIAAVLRAHPEVRKLRVEGHTDNVGDDQKNLELSQQRADAVKAYLIAKGIDASRLEAAGFGENRPMTVNITKKGREQNRRVEFVITDPAPAARSKTP